MAAAVPSTAVASRGQRQQARPSSPASAGPIAPAAARASRAGSCRRAGAGEDAGGGVADLLRCEAVQPDPPATARRRAAGRRRGGAEGGLDLAVELSKTQSGMPAVAGSNPITLVCPYGVRPETPIP